MADGRMIKRKISVDWRLTELANDTNRLLFTWGIPHLDIDGRIIGDPREFKATVAPMLGHITKEVVLAFFEDAEKLDLIQRYQVNGQWVIQYPGFKKNQSLRPEKEAPSRYPPPPSDHLPCKSGTTPGPLPEDSGTTPAKEKLSKEKLKKEMSKSSAGEAARPPSLSVNDLSKIWNEIADPVFPRVRLPLNDGRVRAVQAAIKAHPERAWWVELFNRVNGSPFLTGQNDRKWRGNFDWVIKKRDQIMEGTYDPLAGADTSPPKCSSCGGSGYIKDRETEKFYECTCRKKGAINE